MSEKCTLIPEIRHIEDRLVSIDATLKEQAVDLNRCTVSLELHIERTNEIQDDNRMQRARIDTLEKDAYVREKAMKTVMWAVPVLVTVIPIILKYI
jgi:hypothetical protein